MTVHDLPTTAALERRVSELEATVRFLARGVLRASSGQTSAYTERDFERLRELAGDD